MKYYGNKVPSLEELDRYYNFGSSSSNDTPHQKLVKELSNKLGLESLPGVGPLKDATRHNYLLPPYLYTPQVVPQPSNFELFNPKKNHEIETKCRYIITEFIRFTNSKILQLSNPGTIESFLDSIAANTNMDEISKFIERYGWEKLCIEHVLEEEFIKEWIEFMDIGTVLRNQPLSIDFLHEYRYEIKSEKLSGLIGIQEWYMFTKFLIVKSKEFTPYDIHVNRDFFRDFRNRYHAQQFKDFDFKLSHSNDEVVRYEGVFKDRIKVFSYMDIPRNTMICTSSKQDWRFCEIGKTTPMRENEVLWELNIDLNLDKIEIFTIFE